MLIRVRAAGVNRSDIHLREGGSMLKPRDANFKTALTAEVEQQVWPLLLDGRLKPVVYRTFLLSEAAEAQQFMADGEHIGKITLEIPEKA